MRLGARAAGSLLLAWLVLGEQAPASRAATGGPDRDLIVGVAPGAQAAAARRLGAPLAPGIRLVARPGATPRALRALPGVRWVEPNRRFGASVLPDDPLLGRQWALRAPAGIRAPRAWWTTTGGDVTVAVLDSGIQADHPDLAGNLWTNPAEIPGNGRDDDENGWVDDLHGTDVVAGDGEPEDGLGHGTAVAGVIGARGGNSLGISGVAWRVDLQAIKVLDDGGVGSTATVVAGMRYAVEHGARVINVSLNGPQGSRALEEAVAAAEAAGAVVVTSAGNDGQSREQVSSYPASIESDALVSVASTGAAGRLAPSSAYGAAGVDLAAPGDGVLTTTPAGYGERWGTSFAAAHVSGVLALLAAARPHAGGTELRGALVRGARMRRALAGLVGFGQVDAAGAMAELLPGSGPRVRLVPAQPRGAARACPLAAWRTRGDSAAIARYRLVVDGRRARPVTAAAKRRGRCGRRLAPGRHSLRVTALDGSGMALAALSLRVRVPARTL